MTPTNFDAPVLIAGGGLVGLSAAMFLAQHGVRSLAIERRQNVLQLSRAAFFHMRTIELFRSCGIEAEVRAQSEKEFTPEGAIVAAESLAGKQIVGSRSLVLFFPLSICPNVFGLNCLIGMF